MADSNKYKSSLIEIELDHEGKSTQEYIKTMDKRFKAFKRQLLWALATDLLELVTDKIPSNRKYDRIVKALKIGEVASVEPAFAVYLDDQAKRVRPIDIPKTVIYVRATRSPKPVNPAVQILIDKGPWTVDTIPFWPDRTEASVIQRKVDVKLVNKIAKMQEAQRIKVDGLLKEAGKVNQADKNNKATRKRSQTAKAVPDMAFEMLSLEFDGKKSTAPWRSSLLELSPGKVKTLLSRYKKIEQTLLDTRYNSWDRYPGKVKKLTEAQARSFAGFQKKLGY